MKHFSDYAFSPAVKAVQSLRGSRDAMARLETHRSPKHTITQDLATFIHERTSFYIATASADGQPYVQHRGGPQGFLSVADPQTLVFADFTGNGQYITEGNLTENPRALLFLMDYPMARRIKIWGQAEMVSDLASAKDRLVIFHVDAWDENCPRFIPNLTANEDIPALKAKIALLEARLAAKGET